jgi:hypothetical protein
MFEPWIGGEYQTTRLLLLGESCYAWQDNDGVTQSPSPRHSIEIVQWAIEDFEHTRGFMKTLCRAITNAFSPSVDRLAYCWDRVAFTNYVPMSLDGPRQPVSSELWNSATKEFRDILERTKPKRIIVLGKQMWGHMPVTPIVFNDDVQAYQLSSGDTCYCWAVSHPSHGLSWQTLAGLLHFVCGDALSGMPLAK